MGFNDNALRFRGILHIEHNGQWQTKVHHLGYQEQSPFQIGHVHNGQYKIRLIFLIQAIEYTVNNNFVLCIGINTIGSRQVNDRNMSSLDLNSAPMFVEGYSRIISNISSM